MSDWMGAAIDQVGRRRDDDARRAQAIWLATEQARYRAEDAGRANQAARWANPNDTFDLVLPPDLAADQVKAVDAARRNQADLKLIRAVPQVQPWLSNPRNASAVRDNLLPIAAAAGWFGPATRNVDYRGRDLGTDIVGMSLYGKERPVWARGSTYTPRTTAEVLSSITGQGTEEDRAARIEAGRPTAGAWSVTRGLAVDVSEGFRQTYYGMAMYLLDAMGAKDSSYFDEWRDSFIQSKEKQQLNNPIIEGAFGRALYGGASSLFQTAPALMLAPFTDGASLLTIMGTQTGAQAYGKYRARGGTPDEALLGGVGEGVIEGVTEALPVGFLINRFGKKGAASFVAGYLGREMLGEQIATAGQDALDTAIANPNATWAQYVADRPEAIFNTAVATVMGSAAIGGAHGILHAAARTSQDVQMRADTLAGTKFLDQAIHFARETSLSTSDPQGLAEFINGQAEASPVKHVYIPAEAVRSLFQAAGEDYHENEFWAPYAQQIDEGAKIGGDVVLPIGDAIAHLAGEGRWETFRDSMRLSPGGLSMAESRAIEESYSDVMASRGEEAAAIDRSQAEAAAPEQRVYDEVLVQARKSGMSLNAARTYAEIWTSRYSTRAAMRGSDAWTVMNESVRGIVSDIPDGLRPYDRADTLDRLVNTMRRDKAGASDAVAKGPSLLEWIAARGGIEDRNGDLAAMNAEKWHQAQPFRRKLVAPTEDRSQGALAGIERGATDQSPERLFEAAISEGYFPELVGRETTESDFHSKADLQTFYDAISAELQGSPTYSLDKAREGETAVDRELRSHAEDLRGFLETRGVDPDTASIEDIRAAMAETQDESPIARTFGQWRSWNTPPPGMSDLVLHHNGPTNLPRGRPVGMLANYFGTGEFSDVHGTGFGPWRYTFWVPHEVADRIVDLGSGMDGEVSEAGREFAAEAATRAYPNDETIAEYADKLRAGDAEAWAEFYEVWADSANLQPLLVEQGYAGARFAEEHLLLPEAIAMLVDRRNGPDDGSISFYQQAATNPPFFSMLQRTVEGAKLTKASGAQWKSTLLNAVGVKAEEMDWSGLSDWLDLQEGPVERADVQRFLQDGGIRVSEVVLGEYDGRAVNAEAERLMDARIESAAYEMLDDDPFFADGPPIMPEVEETENGFEFDGWAYDTMAEAEGVRADAQAAADREHEADALGSAREKARRNFDVEDFLDEAKTNLGAVTQFPTWTTTEEATPSYRELLITLPIAEGVNPRKAPKTHWEQPGVVAHARFQSKLDAEGRPVLFVEEVQSDWHQKGRDEGYERAASPEEVERIKAARMRAVERQQRNYRALIDLADEFGINPPDEVAAPERDFLGFTLKDQPLDEQASWAERALRRWQGGSLVNGKDPGPFDPARDAAIEAARAEYSSARLEVAETEAALSRALTPSGIPNAPFAKTWPALVMKRLIRWAVDNGYHSVAWTTGEQQSDRYNMSATLGRISAYPHTADGFAVFAFDNRSATDVLLSNGAAEGTPPGYPDRAVMSREQAVAALGELGGRAFDGAVSASREAPATFEAGDLAVGGEGMRAFYDRNLVNITNDVVKRYGAKVAQMDVALPSPVADQMDAAAKAARASADILARQGDEREAQRLYDDANVAEADAARLREAVLEPQWGFEVTPKMADAAREGFSLFQSGEAKPRGRIDFGTDGRALIRLFDGRDLSTLLHESSHLWLEELRHDANRPGAPQRVKDDWKIVRQWFIDNGHAFPKGGAIPTDAHELWARGSERYFMEGKAPTAALQRAFATFRSWLLRIYKVIAHPHINVPLTDEVRGVMDRLLATEDAITASMGTTEQGLAFASAAEAGMTQPEFDALREANATVRTEANDALLYKTMATIRAARTAEWKAERDRVRAEVDEQVRARPEFKALALLRSRNPAERVSINRESFVLAYGSDALALMPRGVPATIVDQGGVHPDIVAEAAGFKTGQEMVDMLIGVERRQRELRMAQDRRSVLQETIDLGTDKVMNERHGDPLNDGSIEEEALAALATDKRSEVIAAEGRYLARRTVLTGRGNRVPTPLTLVRQWAEAKVRDGKVSEEATAAALQRHQRNAAKAARAVREAVVAQDIDKAFVENQRQLYHQELWRAAKNAKDAIDAVVKRLGKFERSRGMPSIDSEYLDRIHDLMRAYDFRPRSRPQIAERSSFKDWVAAKEAAGEEVYVPPRLRDFDKVNFKDATVADLIGLDDAVQSLAHLGRRKKKMLLGKAEEEYEAVVAEAVASAEQLKSLPVSVERNPDPTLRSRARGLDSLLVKVEHLADQLDGNNPNGAFNRVLVQGAHAAASEKSRLFESVVRPLADLYNSMSKDQQRRMREKVAVPEMVTRNIDTGVETPTVFERSELITIALNVGNESNLNKLVRGESRIVSDQSAWTADMVMKVLDRELTQEDWTFVEAVWRQVDSLWPAIVRAEREISGVTPEKVEPRIVQTKFGPINGGYFPVVYDPTRSSMAEANYEDDAAKLLGQMGRVISTPKGHTITRTEAAAPFMLSLEAVMLNHINRVTTRIAYGRYVRDALKFIKDGRIASVIDRKLGREYRQQLQPWLQRQVNDAALDTSQLRAIDKLLRGFRTSATIVGLGFRFTTMTAQAAGLSNSIAEIGPKYVALGMGETVGNIGHLRDFVFEKSPMMAERATEFDRDVRTFFADLAAKQGPLDRFRAMAYWGIGNVQLFTVDMPTWFGGYHKALDEGMTEDQAIAYADKVVRKSQSSGRAADLSALQDSAEGYRVMTMFYSFWNAFYNKQRETVHAARSGDWRRAGMNVAWVMMVGPILSAFLTGDWPDDESDESVFHWAMRKMFFGLWAGLPVIREMAAGAERESVGKPAFDAQTPMVRAVDAMKKPLGDLYAVSKGDAPSDRWVQNAITAPGYFFRLPTGQAGASAQYLYDYARGEQQPDGVGQFLYGTAKGPQENQRDAVGGEAVPAPVP